MEKTHDVTIDYASQQQQRPYLCIFDSVRWIHLAFVKMPPGTSYTPVARCSLFVLKVPLNTDQSVNRPAKLCNWWCRVRDAERSGTCGVFAVCRATASIRCSACPCRAASAHSTTAFCCRSPTSSYVAADVDRESGFYEFKKKNKIHEFYWILKMPTEFYF